MNDAGAPQTDGGVVRYSDLADAIRRAPARCGRTRLVAIDGPAGAGKTVFAGRLSTSLADAALIHSDDFASWEHQFDWWGRFESAVLTPLERGGPFRFRAYDWDAGRLGPWVEVPEREVVLVEGVSSARRAVSDLLTMTIWLDAPRVERLARGIARDGEATRAAWERWMAGEDEHFATDGTRERADVVVDSAPSTAHDPDDAFVVVGGTMFRP